MRDFFINNLISIDIINSISVMLAIAFVVSRVGLYEDEQLKALLIFLAILASILVFGLINETRVYFILIPFLIFFKISVDTSPDTMPVEDA